MNKMNNFSDFWNKVINSGKLLSDEEVESILRTSKRIRSKSRCRKFENC